MKSGLSGQDSTCPIQPIVSLHPLHRRMHCLAGDAPKILLLQARGGSMKQIEVRIIVIVKSIIRIYFYIIYIQV